MSGSRVSGVLIVVWKWLMMFTRHTVLSKVWVYQNTFNKDTVNVQKTSNQCEDTVPWPSGTHTTVGPMKKIWLPFCSVLDFKPDLNTWTQTLKLKRDTHHPSTQQNITAEGNLHLSNHIATQRVFHKHLETP